MSDRTSANATHTQVPTHTLSQALNLDRSATAIIPQYAAVTLRSAERLSDLHAFAATCKAFHQASQPQITELRRLAMAPDELVGRVLQRHLPFSVCFLALEYIESRLTNHRMGDAEHLAKLSHGFANLVGVHPKSSLLLKYVCAFVHKLQALTSADWAQLQQAMPNDWHEADLLQLTVCYSKNWQTILKNSNDLWPKDSNVSSELQLIRRQGGSMVFHHWIEHVEKAQWPLSMAYPVFRALEVMEPCQGKLDAFRFMLSRKPPLGCLLAFLGKETVLDWTVKRDPEFRSLLVGQLLSHELLGHEKGSASPVMDAISECLRALPKKDRRAFFLTLTQHVTTLKPLALEAKGSLLSICRAAKQEKSKESKKFLETLELHGISYHGKKLITSDIED